MIIQDYRFVVKQIGRLLYEGVTSFGYFTKEALAQQVGLRGEQRWEEPACDIMEAYPESTLLSRSPLLMVDTLGRSDAPGGKYGLGVLYGRKMVDPKEWFFEAHFYQDPVMPGSLGLQALEQVLKAEAWRRWPDAKAFVAPLGHEHRWTYRGQVIPKAKQVSYAVHLKQIDEEQRLLRADAWLYCDGLPIYGLEDLTLVGE
jgi:3-hydroxymyristoyl/3-hydroxydecanoyl-(acyl carrier protein) dehydratase